jgi:hypothetical protein
MDDALIKRTVELAIERENGILDLRPCWVARDFLPPGKRLGLEDGQYAVGERGYICERWLGSETKADNRIGPEDEGLSYLAIEGLDITLKDAVRLCGPTMMGPEYAKIHKNLGRLAKIFDYKTRLFFHMHQKERDARKVGRNPKEEAYFFPEGVEMGRHPETFFGVHPSLVEQNSHIETLLPYLVEWNSDLILKHSRAYLQVPGEGFHLPAGGLHAPGTALTIELQEASDVLAVLQARVEAHCFSKDLLFKDVSEYDRLAYGERFVLEQVDWHLNSDCYFYENRHTSPVTVDKSIQSGGHEEWIFYNTEKFSGKKLTVSPGCSYRSTDNGVYNVLVWQGCGTFDGRQIAAFEFGTDELIVTHEKAISGVEVKNMGSKDLILFKFFGPEINAGEIPYLPEYKG